MRHRLGLPTAYTGLVTLGDLDGAESELLYIKFPHAKTPSLREVNFVWRDEGEVCLVREDYKKAVHSFGRYLALEPNDGFGYALIIRPGM
jgi:hypothetical protein